MKIDHEAIKNLAGLINETGLTEIEISEGDSKIRVAKSVNVQSFTAPQAMPAFAPANAPAPVAATGGSVAATAPENHPGAVKSPMVGTAYLQPEPGSPRFAPKGGKVKAGDTLVIIEAMKVMNPIKAEKAGTVVDVLIEDGQPVEFGQPMFIIE